MYWRAATCYKCVFALTSLASEPGNVGGGGECVEAWDIPEKVVNMTFSFESPVGKFLERGARL